MKLKRTPEFLSFLSTYFSDADSGSDFELAQEFASKAAPARLEPIVNQAKLWLQDPELPMDEFGTEANRWFGSDEEARAWLSEIVRILDKGQPTQGLFVKDSNGALLAEGDSVIVIKDLKVKGGSSDLKRGTLIKKIHLIDDPDLIECRVDGSTLVLKTCFLKKS